tara:strand:+ start:1115 stop:1282 length:168 start_codon:yes stop_codon:yes gene_type:complete
MFEEEIDHQTFIVVIGGVFASFFAFKFIINQVFSLIAARTHSRQVNDLVTQQETV